MKHLLDNKLVVPLVLLLLAAASLALLQRNSRFEELEHRTAALESAQGQLAAPAPNSALRAAEEDINDLYAQIQSLREQLSSAQRHDDYPVENNRSVAALVEGEIAAPESASIAGEIFELGYVDEQTWATMEESLQEMSVAESKLLWQKMFTGIEDGSIEVYLGQE